MLNPTFQLSAIREFQKVRGELITKMLEDGLNALYVNSGDYYFDEIELLIGNKWSILASVGSADSFEVVTDATAEELEVYGEAKRFGDFCAKYGVKR